MRKTIIAIIACVAILLAGYVGYRSYKVWKQGHMLALAHEFLKKSDQRNALLCVEQVLHSNPKNLEATRMMAQFSEENRLPNALLWRSRVVELDPSSLNDRLALAQTAMAMRDYRTATNALAGVAAADKKTAAYHNVAGAVAAGANQTAEAETHFLEACRLEPQNMAPQMNLAVVRLHETNSVGLEEARATLRRLSANPTNAVLRTQALRELTMDALHHKGQGDPVALCQQLLKETNSVFADSILQLDVLNQTHSPDFKPTLKKCQTAAEGQGGRIYELANWEMAHTSPGETLTWLRSLPKATQTNQPTTLLITEGYTVTQNWRDLQAWLTPQKWGETDFIRHAFLTRALRGLELADSAKVEWDQAFKGANGKKQGLEMLLNMAAQWNWVNESEDLLQTIVAKYPNEAWAKQALIRMWFANGQTRSMMQFYSEQVKKSDADISAKNNLALTALLLNAQEFRPGELALEAYQKSPTNASYASTYAFALYTQKKNADALKIMEKLTPAELQDPSVAGYYGLILKAAGNRAQAGKLLNIATKGHLLPEEKKLFEKARDT